MTSLILALALAGQCSGGSCSVSSGPSFAGWQVAGDRYSFVHASLGTLGSTGGYSQPVSRSAPEFVGGEPVWIYADRNGVRQYIVGQGTVIGPGYGGWQVRAFGDRIYTIPPQDLVPISTAPLGFTGGYSQPVFPFPPNSPQWHPDPWTPRDDSPPPWWPKYPLPYQPGGWDNPPGEGWQWARVGNRNAIVWGVKLSDGSVFVYPDHPNNRGRGL
jgi:hypothetical protein